MVLKTYSVLNDFSSGLISHQLETQIIESSSVTGYQGLLKEGDELCVLGDSMDETALDAVIAAHVPDYTQIYIHTTVKENKEFADRLMQKIKEKNISDGLASIDQAAWVHHRMRKVPYQLSVLVFVDLDILNLVVAGDIETAEFALSQMTPDNMTQPYHWLNQERIDWIRNEIRTYLGWPLI